MVACGGLWHVHQLIFCPQYPRIISWSSSSQSTSALLTLEQQKHKFIEENSYFHNKPNGAAAPWFQEVSPANGKNTGCIFCQPSTPDVLVGHHHFIPGALPPIKLHEIGSQGEGIIPRRRAHLCHPSPVVCHLRR